MKKINTILLGLSTASLMFLAACNNSSPTSSTPTPIPKPEPTTEANPESTTEIATEDHSQPAGGQVIEAGKYHLEFVPEAEADKFHLDFYLQSGDTHEPVTDAQVTGQIQLPSGNKKASILPMTQRVDTILAFCLQQNRCISSRDSDKYQWRKS